MTTVEASHIGGEFSRYLDRVKAGETILITDEDRAVAEIRPVERVQAEPRPYGLCTGQFRVPDDFDAPLPEEVLAQFEG